MKKVALIIYMIVVTITQVPILVMGIIWHYIKDSFSYGMEIGKSIDDNMDLEVNKEFSEVKERYSDTVQYLTDENEIP